MATFDEFKTIKTIDVLQLILQEEKTVRMTKELLSSYDIPQYYYKLYLSSYLFAKFPEFYPNISSEFKNVINLVYDNINLVENIYYYERLFKEWQNTDLAEMIEEIDFMKNRTREASSETENPDCKECYSNQENILNIAQGCLKEFKSRRSI